MRDLSTDSKYRSNLKGRWEWEAHIYDIRSMRNIEPIFIVRSGADFASFKEAEANFDAVLTSLSLPRGETFWQPEDTPKSCSFCHGSGQTIGTPYDKPETCPCGAKT